MESLIKNIEQPYGFGGRLTESFPSQVIVDITEVCNLACIHCPHRTFKKSKYYNARQLDPELNAKLVNEVRKYGQGITQYIRYSSEGEPLLHPRAYEMIEFAIRHSGVFVTLTTNGTVLNEKKMKNLFEAGLHMIDVSLDAFTPETYAKIRVNGDLNITKVNVLKLIEWSKQPDIRTKIVVSFIEQANNKHETELFKKYWKKQGASHVVIRRLHSAGGAIQEISELISNKNCVEERRPCLYPWERIVLNPRGFLAFCPADWSHGSSIASYQEVSIKDCWQSKFYKQLRSAHLNNDFKNQPFCNQCPDWRETRWLNEGKSYADMIQKFLGTS